MIYREPPHAHDCDCRECACAMRDNFIFALFELMQGGVDPTTKVAIRCSELLAQYGLGLSQKELAEIESIDSELPL